MSDVEWLDPDEQVAWRAYLRGVSVVLDSLNQDMVERNGLSLNEYEVLAHLSETPNRQMRMSALAERLVHSRSRLTHTVRRLEEQGLVRREACASDRRGVNCILTDAGYDRLVLAAPSHVNAVRRVLVDRIGHDQLITLGEICSQFLCDGGVACA